ncbi:ribosomal protein L29 [Rubidibacter lacunae KORDI 51-2]|uniref:Large ribosomal subunit protein uL29 n=1 Tax=Rubidibacter lacunae KORDI 51-2 TaxID=582515 RepID=U5DCG7_9CHRO|nr:50S ribosomal protein L29 [Rubidibacter lacunae]ERN42223.1 ribosomal protein L29 [Rubidibacter lacunae KORDI 51-2]
MAFPNIAEVREWDDAAIAQAIVDIKRQLFQLRLEQAKGELEQPHQFKHARHRLAQLLTVEHERQLAQAATGSEAEVGTDGAPESVTTVGETTSPTEEE